MADNNNEKNVNTNENQEINNNANQNTNAAPKQETAPVQNTQAQNTMDDFFGDDGLIDGSKPDAFERNLAEQKAKEEQAKKTQEQTVIPNAFEDDDFIDGSKPDAFERRLAEQQPIQPKEAEKNDNAPKKNFFDMEDDEQIVQQETKTVSQINREKRPVMKDSLSAALNEEDPKVEPVGAKAQRFIEEERQRIAEADAQRKAEADAHMNEVFEKFRADMKQYDEEEAAEKAAKKAAKEERRKAKEAAAKKAAEEAQKAEEAKQRENVAEQKEEAKPINNDVAVAVYTEKLEAYNNMYKLHVDSNEFASSITESWAMITSGDRAKLSDGYIMLNNVFKDTLKKAFDVEKNAAYEEHRLPEYAEIVRSTNELLRSAMYGLTDVYHNPNRKNLFASTAFGGLTAKDIGDLTVGDSLWEKDQKSDEAWDIQAKEAKDIADKWLKENKPYEKMISEMKELVTANKEGVVSRKETLDKLTAAEWLLIHNEKMMVEDPEDPLNPIPNWGNRYWKALAETREALGINKHTSMREMIQSDYAAMAKAVSSADYNKLQIQQYVLDEDVRELSDSMEAQKEAFTAQSRDIIIKAPSKENADEKAVEGHENEIRWREPVKSEDEREKMKKEPKVFSNLLVEKINELTINSAR